MVYCRECGVEMDDDDATRPDSFTCTDCLERRWLEYDFAIERAMEVHLTDEDLRDRALGNLLMKAARTRNGTLAVNTLKELNRVNREVYNVLTKRQYDWFFGVFPDLKRKGT